MSFTAKKRAILVAISALILVFTGYMIWSNLTFQTTVYKIALPSEQSALSGLTIAHISDLHNETFGENLVRAIERQKPDLIAITGDLVDSSKTDIETAMVFIREAIKIAPIYYVTGNHEGKVYYDSLKSQLASLGVTILENEKTSFAYRDTAFTILGVHDPVFTPESVYRGTVSIMQETLSALSANDGSYTLLLSHRPELFEVYAQHNMNLILSGHAHGGQFRLPLIGGLYAPSQGFFPTYTSGVFTKNNTQMVVSRGLGNSIIPIRIFNRPELVIIKLQNETISSSH